MGAWGAWVRGCVGAWVRGCMGAWLHGCVGAWVRGCVADDNAGVGDGGGVVAVSAGMSIWVVHVVQVLCMAQLT